MTQAAVLSAGQTATGGQQPPEGPDISRLASHLQQEWDHERNAHLGPIKITPGIDRKVWWTQGLCQSGQPHRWTARISARTGGTGCPYGKGGQLACPCNDLAHTNPAVAAELDLDPGDPRTGESIRASSLQKVPWRCGVCSHRWHTTVNHRTRLKQPSGCPECWERARCKPHLMHPSIAEGSPDLLADWDYPLNSQEGWHPDTVTLMSRKPIHWVRTDECRLGLPHRWQAPPYSRIYAMRGSPYPSGLAVCDCNSLALNCQDAAAFWNPVLNPDTPHQVAVQSNKVMHWMTPDGRQWQQKVSEVVATCRRHKRSL